MTPTPGRSVDPESLAVAAAPESLDASRPGWSWAADSVSVALVVPADSLRLRLPRGWIRPETFRLSAGDTLALVRGLDYLLDPRRGALRLLRPFPPGTRLFASYRAFPVPLRPEYRRRFARAPGAGPPPEEQEEEIAVAAPLSAPDDGSVRFDLSGSKTFAIEVGSRRDVALRQSLDLAVDGRVGRDVTVNAVLTDRRAPLEPEGGSARLGDLDRILVEVQSPNTRLTLGDIRLVAPVSEFLRYDRRLQGVRGEATRRGVSAFAAGATAPGVYVTREFLGEEGKQGPYLLGSPSTSETGGIVAASERVWLDGLLLERGEAEDYILDYAEATLTFTGRRPITAYSEITVEYQIAAERYRRSVYGAGFGFGGPAATGGAERFRAAFLAEGDASGRPLLPLTEAQREALRAAGDADTSSLGSGIRFVGTGNGEYDLVRNDTLAVSFFLYKGAGGGAYQVRFEDVGEDRGDYTDTTAAGSPERFWVYAGPRRGRFLPAAAVPRPERTLLASLSAEPDLGPRFGLRAELAASDHDANTFSSRDDDDNRGAAWLVDGRAGPVRAGPAALTLNARWRDAGSRFRPLDRLDPAFFAQDWLVAADRLERGDRRRALGAELELGPARLRATTEDLDNRRDFRGERGTWEGSLRAGSVTWTGTVQRVRTRDAAGEVPVRGRRAVERSVLLLPGAWIAAQAGYTRERNETGAAADRSGGFFREGRARLGTGSRFTVVAAEVEWIRRVDWALAGSRERRLDTGDTGLLRARWVRAGGRLLEAEASRRVLRPAGEGERRTSHLGRLRWSERAAADAIIQEGRWELSSSDRASRRKEIRFVGAGAGRYDSLGVFVGQGDYEIYYLDLSDSARVNRLDFSLRNELDLSRLAALAGPSSPDSGGGPAREAPWRRALRTLRVIHTWTAVVESRRSAGWFWPRLLPVLAGERALPLVEASMRAEASALPSARWLSPRLRWERRQSYRSFLASSLESSRSWLWSLRLRSRPADRWTADVETEWDDTETSVLVSGAGGARDGWRSLRLRGEQRVQIAKPVSAGLDASARFRDRHGRDEQARIWQGTPFVVWNPQLRSRMELRATRTSVAREGGGAEAGRLLEAPGWDLRLTGTIRLREELDLSLWFREQRPDRAAAVRDGRLELRATF